MVFRDPEAGKYLNENFVSIKIDGEKGEGPELMERFSVRGFPTVILFDAEGNEIDRIVGFGGKDSFMRTVKEYAEGINTLAYWRKQLEEKPDDLTALIVLAEKLWERDDRDAALPHYRKLVELDKNAEQGQTARLRLAQYSLSKDTDAAPLEKLVKDKSLSPNLLQEAYINLLNYYNRQNNTQKTVEMFEAFVTTFPGNAGMMNNYAWYIFQEKMTDRYSRGIELAEKALQLEPQADHIWDTLAQLHFAAGNVSDAIEAMEKAVSLNPSEESYKELLQQYKKSQNPT